MASLTDYKTIASIAQKRRDAALASFYSPPTIPEEKLPKDLTNISRDSGWLTVEEVEIVESEAEDILLKVRERIWTAVEVAQAFCKSAAMAQKLV